FPPVMRAFLPVSFMIPPGTHDRERGFSPERCSSGPPSVLRAAMFSRNARQNHEASPSARLRSLPQGILLLTGILGRERFTARPLSMPRVGRRFLEGGPPRNGKRQRVSSTTLVRSV